jgi:hypothetical protein
LLVSTTFVITIVLLVILAVPLLFLYAHFVKSSVYASITSKFVIRCLQYGEYQATILSLNQSGCSGSGGVGVPGIYHSPNATAPILVY